ncbi:hypothetical protein ACPPVO_26630 [Dactylosporangium sp. McL0621]|uniref:hypothetical protein n=1 Tax=Dactylosporangium sp. McL0621 TaxID=3415678 RepID=UPI003CE67A7A
MLATMLGARPTVPGEDRRHGVTVAAQARPDRWWFGLGRPTRPIEDGGDVPDGGREQTTQGYIWAFTADEAQRHLWWGTVSNATGGGMATLAGEFAGAGLGVPVRPWDDPDNVTCEFAASYNAAHDVAPAQGVAGDVVAAQVWQYDIATGIATERTPDPGECPDFARLAGVRAAGSIGDVVLLGGVETTTTAGPHAGGTVVLLAYHVDGTFLGARRFPEWDNIKNFVVAGGRLYFGVGRVEPPSGGVQRWCGTAADPFRFEEVGRLGNQPAYFTVHENRIVTGTWHGTGSTEPAGVYVSPPLHELGPRARDRWRPVFTAAQLFPDPLTADAMVSFAVTSYEGWVYATFGLPSVAPSMTRHLAAYPQIPRGTVPELALAYLRSSPGGVVYRIKNPGELNQQVELLYGERRYWCYEPGTAEWALRDNLLHQDPRFGGGGFGSRFNDYVGWGAAVFRGKLYLGTFNTEKVLRDITLNPDTGVLSQVLGRPVPAVEAALCRQVASRLVFRDRRTAGQVWVFDDADRPARPLTTTGFNNACNWGIRGVLPVGDEHLFFGTNQGWQYPTEPRDDPPRRAGWQLLKL